MVGLLSRGCLEVLIEKVENYPMICESMMTHLSFIFY